MMHYTIIPWFYSMVLSAAADGDIALIPLS